VLAFGGNLETRASAQTSKFLIPKSSALPARDSYRVAWALHRSSVLSLGWGVKTLTLLFAWPWFALTLRSKKIEHKLLLI
jgi:hypothetical protein